MRVVLGNTVRPNGNLQERTNDQKWKFSLRQGSRRVSNKESQCLFIPSFWSFPGC
jgi:hypothetical protein